MVLLLILGLAAATSAQASCGDYVIVGSGRVIPMQGHAPATEQDSFTDHRRNLPPLPACRGPHCGNRHGLPLPTTPTLPHSGVEHWGCLLADGVGLGMARASAIWDVCPRLPAGHPSSIDRPPKSLRG
ncbi:MAG: hypothetical protein AB7O62_04350 [Pirellulales bacterium]